LSLEPGRNLLHYRLIEKIGEGGMGVVWKAVDTTLDREVAIKVLPDSPGLASDERLDRFKREAKLLASLNHPNIAAVYGLHEAEGVRFLAMEWVPGEDLAQRLGRGPLSTDDAIDVATRIAEALEAAHEQSVVHRDLKPANVLRTPDGKIKVLDFGLAKALSPDDASKEAEPSFSPTVTAGTVAGVILGTAAYMSPEQARGQPVDRRADVWAFGCVLYEMLTGRPAFPGGTITDILAAVVTREPDLDALPSDLPVSVRRLIRRCLAKNPHDRLQAIGDARLELEEPDDVVDAGTAPATPARRGWLWAGVLATIAAVIGAAAGLLFAPTAEAPAPVRVRALTFGGTDYTPTASPDGRLVAFASARGGTSRIWLKQLAGGGEQPLTEGSDSFPQFSPDGSSVLFMRDESGVRSAYRVGLVGGQPRRVVGSVFEACWSPDGNEIAFIRADRTEAGPMNAVGVIGIDGGPERILLSLEGWILRGIDWSPDGRNILVTRSSPTGGATGWQALVVDVGDGNVREVGPGGGTNMVSVGAWSPDGSSIVLASMSNTIGDLSGVPARVLRFDVERGTSETLFWRSGLFPFRGNETGSTRFSALGDGRLLFDTYEQRETLVEVATGDGTVRGRTRGTAADRQPAYSPDGRTVVFSSNRAGNLDLWLLDLETGSLTQLTDDVAQDWDPAFTPDGRHLLYSSDRGGNLEIWMAGADGSEPRQVSSDGVDAENPTMTADGEWIVYVSGNTANLGVFRIRPDGSDATLLASGNFIVPEVSPDGRYALYALSALPRPAEVRVVEIETGETVDFRIEIPFSADSPNVTYGRSRWMHGGDAIAFLGLDDRGRPGVYVQDFAPGRDTASTRRPLAGFFEHDITESFDVSPDGTHVILATVQEARNVMLAEGVPGF
jgi:Tol biopolymer transport system component